MIVRPTVNVIAVNFVKRTRWFVLIEIGLRY